MFKINRKLEYTLISLKYMSQKSPGQLTSAKEICELYKTPFDPTSRGLQILAQHEILQAEQGAHGGYQIIKDLTKFSLKELSDIIVGPIEIANCLHEDSSNCTISSCCQIISPMLYLNEKLNNLFSNISIAELLEASHVSEKDIRNKKISAS